MEEDGHFLRKKDKKLNRRAEKKRKGQQTTDNRKKEQTDKISTTRNMRSERNGEAKKILTALGGNIKKISTLRN